MDDLMFDDEIIPIIPPQVCGWLQSKLSSIAIDKLWEYIEKYKNYQNHNHRLAGNISSSWRLYDDDNWFFNNVVLPLCISYSENFTNLGINYATTKIHNYCLSDFWVNYQKQCEFNPPHIHTACIYSFVIWLKIPFDYREQHELPISKNSNNPCASNFQFIYRDLFGHNSSYSYFLDKNSEGTILFFPAQLQHQVFPFFNSNEDRISVAGNISLDTSYFID